jgi:serine/threonine protein kinase
VFRVLQHLVPATLDSGASSRASSRPPSRTPSRAAADSGAASPRRSTTPAPLVGLAVSDAAVVAPDAGAALESPAPRCVTPEPFASHLSDADMAPSPVRKNLLGDFDGDALPQMVDPGSAHSSFKNFKRAASADLAGLCERMRAAGLVRARTQRLRTHDACFVARELVTWLVDNRVVQSRDSAVVLGEVMRGADLFRSLQGAAQFADDGQLYRFAADDAAVAAAPAAAISTGLEDSDDDAPTGADAASGDAARVDVEAYPTICLHREDDCLKVDLVQGQCLLPSEGLYTLVWASHASRFSLSRPQAPRLMYSIVLFDGATDADAVATFDDEEIDSSAGKCSFRARAPFAAHLPRELSLAPAELVWVTARNGQWWRGRRASDGVAGWFPAIAVEPASGDAAALLAALIALRCDPRTEGIDLLAAHDRNLLNPAEPFSVPLLAFDGAVEDISGELFVGLARQVRVSAADHSTASRIDDLLCVAFRGAEPRVPPAADDGGGSDLGVPRLLALQFEGVCDSTQRSVWSRARTDVGQEVAVREVGFAKLASASARAALAAEVALLQQLGCDWVAAVLGVWRTPTRGGLVFAATHGGLLQSAIVRARAAPPLDDVLPVRHCLSILLCAARAMNFAHSIGFVLRDLQADTLLLSDNPSTASALVQARLVDVSRARRWLGSAVKNKAAAAAAAAATPSTPTAAAAAASEPMSSVQLDALRVSPPECVAWRKPFVEPLSDVWSLGCLMIELFSWRKAFAELETEARILNALRTGQRPDIGSVLPRYRGRRLLALIECCLRPLPEPLVMLADPDSGRITVGRTLADLERLLTEAQQ